LKDELNPTTVIISRLDDEWASVRFPYDEDFLATMKDSIEFTYRKWDRDKGYWRVHLAFLPELVAICKDNFNVVMIEKSLQHHHEEVPGNGIFQNLFPLIRDAYLDRVYKALAQAFHPDHKGDAELMKQLNEAFRERKSRIAKPDETQSE
jgi:hypothetical protein